MSDNLNKNLCFGTILLEHINESRSINTFNRFWTIYFVTSTGEQQIIVSRPDMWTCQKILAKIILHSLLTSSGFPHFKCSIFLLFIQCFSHQVFIKNHILVSIHLKMSMIYKMFKVYVNKLLWCHHYCDVATSVILNCAKTSNFFLNFIVHIKSKIWVINFG